MDKIWAEMIFWLWPRNFDFARFLQTFALNTSRIKCGGISLSSLFCISNTIETINRFNLFVMFGSFLLTGLTGFYIGGVIVFSFLMICVISLCGHDVIVYFYLCAPLSFFGYDNVQVVFWLADSFQTRHEIPFLITKDFVKHLRATVRKYRASSGKRWRIDFLHFFHIDRFR